MTQFAPKICFASLLVLTGLVFSATAETLAVKQMEFKNNGGYVAVPIVGYRLAQGDRCYVFDKRHKKLTKNNSVTLNLWNNNNFVLESTSGKENTQCSDGEIPSGVEVWGAFFISAGENSQCRKDKKLKLTGYGGKIRYRVGGTTQNGNRCKVSEWPD